jgi:hypothetical protein
MLRRDQGRGGSNNKLTLRQELLLTQYKTIKMKKIKKSSSEPSDAPEAPETPETQISYVQKYELFISFRIVVMKI